MAKQQGMGFSQVMTGMLSGARALLVTFAPWIAGLAAVSGAVYLLNRRHEEHIKKVNEITASVKAMNKELAETAPSLTAATDKTDLATRGAANFTEWLRKQREGMDGFTKSLRENTLEMYRNQVAKAQTNADTLRAENKKDPLGGFGPQFPALRAWWAVTHMKEYTKAAKDQAEADQALAHAKALLAEAEKAPPGAFDDPPKKTKGPGLSAAQKAFNKAKAEGRFDTTATYRGGKVPEIDIDYSPLTVEDPRVFVSRGGLNDFSMPKDVTSSQERMNKINEGITALAKRTYDGIYGAVSGALQAGFEGGAKGVLKYFLQTFQHGLIEGISRAFAKAASEHAGASIVKGFAALFGFAGGGYTGNGGTSAPAGVVHGKEFVFSAPATARIGVANLEALHRSAKGYQAGGYVAPVTTFAANSNQPAVTHNYFSMGQGNLVTETVYEDFQRMADRAEARGAHGGAALAIMQLQQKQTTKLGR